jgi:hypothetical protein
MKRRILLAEGEERSSPELGFAPLRARRAGRSPALHAEEESGSMD